MSPKQLELALKKQRLQLQIAAQREALAQHVTGLHPLFAAADQVRSAGRWLRRNPEVLVAAAVMVLVARPAFILRWLGRGALAWRLWSRLRGGLGRLESLLAPR